MFQFYRRKEIGLSAATHVASNVSLNAMYQHRVHNVSETDRLCWHGLGMKEKQEGQQQGVVIRTTGPHLYMMLMSDWFSTETETTWDHRVDPIDGLSNACSADGNFWNHFLIF